jgi:hypothetical protein
MPYIKLEITNPEKVKPVDPPKKPRRKLLGLAYTEITGAMPPKAKHPFSILELLHL